MDADDQPPKPSFSPTTPPPADETPADSGGGAGIMIPLVVALIGVVFGAIGIFFGLSSQSKVSTLETTVAELQASLPGQISEATASVDVFKGKLSKLNQGVEALKNLSRMNRDSTNRKLDTYAKEIEANRSQINKNTNEISKIPTMVAAAPAPTPAPAPIATIAPASSSDSTAAPAGVAPEGVHIIKSGDTFGRLAAKYGVTVQAIVSANPSLDPRRLRIGQAVNIPSSN